MPDSLKPLTNEEYQEFIDLIESARNNLTAICILHDLPHFRELLHLWPTQIEDAYQKIQEVVDRICVEKS